jgi:fibronectin-binding autotransporter adhesin
MKRMAILAIALSWLVGLVWMAPGTRTAWADQSKWTDGNSNWNNAGNWDNGVPNSSTTDALITDGSSTVTLDTTPSIAKLELASGNTLTTNLGVALSVYGTAISNDGQIVFNGGGGANTSLVLDNSVTLSGAGALTLTVAGGGGNAYLYQAVNGLTLTNQSTIQGAGIVGNGGLALSNAGTVNANSAGQTLQLNGSGGITNTNLLEASDGGVLQIYGVTVNNSGGNITANAGSSVQLLGSTVIQGGTLTNSGTFLGTPGGHAASLDGSTGAGAVTINGTYTSDLNTNTYLLGTITNQGNIQINGGNGNNTTLFMGNNVTLQGGGTVTLATIASGGGIASIQQAVGGLTLTNVDNTIQGSGIIGQNNLTLVNQAGGTINANSTGSPQISTLTIQSPAVTNQGLMEATNNGILQINGSTVNNNGGTIKADGSGASVQIFGSAQIQGGTLTNNGGAFFGTPQNNTAFLDGATQGPLTLNGTYTSDLNTNTYLLGTINNNNNIQLNGGNGNNSFLLIDNSNVTLQGSGTVTLATATGGGNAILEQAAGGLTLTNVDNTIQGSGIIGQNGLTLVNQAGSIINANSMGGPAITTLTIQSATVTNAGLVEATNNGVLQINGVVVNNTGGTIQANGGGAAVQLFGGAQIQGGTLTNNGGAFFGTPTTGTAYLDGSTGSGAVTLNGTYTSDFNTNTYILGTINNNNNFLVKGGAGSNTILVVDSSNVMLQGGGSLTLATSSGGGNTFIEQASGGLTLTNVNNTIQGAGIIGNNNLTLVNQAGGTINANSMGPPEITTLTFQSAAVTNQGLMEASNHGVLQINGVVVNNTGGTIAANGGGASVQFFGSAQIQGGTLTNNGGAFFGTPNGNVALLDGSTGAGAITLNGTYTSDLNTNTYLLGTINNKNNFQVNGGAATNTELIIGNNVTLQGGGTVTLAVAGGGGNTFIQQAAGGLTLTNVDNTLQGAGIIGQNGLSVMNGAAGTILANAPGQTLLLNSSGTLTNNGTLKVTAGTLQKDNMTLSNYDSISKTLTGGTYMVDGTSNSSTMRLSLGSNGGGEIVNNAANIILKGTNAHFIDANSNELLSALASNTTSTSGLTISDGYNLTTPGNFANAGTVTVGSLSTLTIGSAGTNDYTQSGGLTQGTGTITAGNVTINAGTIKPGSSPGILSINGSFTLSDGTFKEEMAAAGQFGVLDVSGGDVNLGSGALLDIILLTGFDPVGHTYTILTDAGGTISGTFANAPASGFQMDGINWNIAYNLNDIILDAESHTVVPLPGSLWLLLSGLAGLGGVRRFRRS